MPDQFILDPYIEARLGIIPKYMDRVVLVLQRINAVDPELARRIQDNPREDDLGLKQLLEKTPLGEEENAMDNDYWFEEMEPLANEVEEESREARIGKK